jgi:hypothetical protein
MQQMPPVVVASQDLGQQQMIRQPGPGAQAVAQQGQVVAGQKPLLLQEQPLLLEDLVEQEKKEQLRHVPGMVPQMVASQPPMMAAAGTQAGAPAQMMTGPVPVQQPPAPGECCVESHLCPRSILHTCSHEQISQDLFFHMHICQFVYRQPGLLCTPRNFPQSTNFLGKKYFLELRLRHS